MPRMDDAVEAKKALEENHSILVYGPSKSGKTQLVATAAKIPEIRNIHWLDGENGSATIRNMGLSKEELSKIILYKIPDVRDNPRFIETTLKMLTSKTKVKVCVEHGAVACAECSKIPNYLGDEFLLSECKHNDLVVIDSGSQLGVSALNASLIGKPATYKPLFDDYGFQGKLLSDALLVVQQCKNTNFVVITHELLTEGEDGVERIYPLIGTKPFSANVAKYFGTVVNTQVKMSKHVAGSSSTYASNKVTGSRLNVALEKIEKPTMRDILVAGGVLKS